MYDENDPIVFICRLQFKNNTNNIACAIFLLLHLNEHTHTCTENLMYLAMDETRNQTKNDAHKIVRQTKISQYNYRIPTGTYTSVRLQDDELCKQVNFGITW